MKRFLRYTARFVVAILLLLLILPVVLYIPAVQRFAKDKAATILSEKTGWNVEVGRFDLRFPLKLRLSGVNGITQQGDTLFHLSSFRTGIALKPLFVGKVVVAEFTIEELAANMVGVIDGFDMVGKIDNFKLSSIDVNLKEESGEVKKILLSDANMRMRILPTLEDTVKTESAPLKWKFKIGELDIQNTDYRLEMVESGFDLNCLIEYGVIKQGDISLETNSYQAQLLEIRNSSYHMDLDSLPPAPGFDPAHMTLTDVNIMGDSIYNEGTTVRARILDASFKERCGFELSSLKGFYAMDSVFMELKNFELTTPHSQLTANARWDQSVLATPRSGNVKALLDGFVGKKDILYFVSAYSPKASQVYPNHDLKLHANIQGDMKRLNISSFNLELPTAFKIKSEGFLNDLDDEKNTSAKVHLDGDLQNLSFVPLLLPDTSLQNQITIPKNMRLEGRLFADMGQYTGNLSLAVGRSKLEAAGSYYPVKEKYMARIEADSVAINQFMPHASMGILSMEAKADGRGFDFLSPATYTNVDAKVKRFDISNYRINDLALQTELKKSQYNVALVGLDSILNIDMHLNGILSRKEITAHLDANLRRIDLYNLKLIDTEKVIAAEIKADANTNLKDIYQLDMHIDNMQLRDQGVLNKLGNLSVIGDIDADSTRVAIRNGDLQLKFDAGSGLDTLLTAFDKSSVLVDKQMKEHYIDLQQLQRVLPNMILKLGAGTQNALYSYVKSSGIRYKDVGLTVTANRESGFRINGIAHDFKKDTLLLNTVDMYITQQEALLDYSIEATSKNKNLKRAFSVLATGELERDKASLDVLFKNGEDQVGFDLGLILSLSAEEMRVHFEPYDPILLFKPWSLNPDNFISLTKDQHVLANFQLTGEKGMQLAIHSKDTLESGKNDLDVALTHFEIAQVSDVLTDVPPFSGMFNANINVAFDQDQLDAKGIVTLDTLVYNKRSLGDLKLDVNYEMSKTVGQWAYASIDLDGQKILEGDVNLNSEDSVKMAANMFMYALPLKLADPFIDGMASLTGTASGQVKMEEINNQPQINGTIDLDSAAVTVTYANATYKLDERPLIIDNNKLAFNNYAVTAYNKNPLLINGNFNFTDFNRMMADLRITGENVELLNVPKQKNQMIYGRLMMDVNTTVKGPLDLLKIRGGIYLLSGTRVNYVMLDSPVSAQNRVSNLITFTSFNDTIDSNYQIATQTASLSGIDMLVTINIAPTVDVGLDLSTDGSDRVELQGGGDLAFRLTPMGNTDLSGRYSLTGGFVRYNLPVLPIAKTFNIRNGSYVEWSGQLMNPYINITASESIRSTVTEGNSSRIVVFEPLIEIRNRLDNLSIVFTVEAPEDMAIQNQLAQMTPEERSRQAMNLIITQSYTGPGTTSKANSNNALNAFIQKEINTFAGNALKGVDLSVGIDTYDQFSADGNAAGKRTDYSFRFSKQLFNDRFRVVVGGTVSSGQVDPTDQQDGFIDDITLEYMLDKSGTRYLKLFHHTGFESVLEGKVVETGIGAVLKRRVQKIRQLFIFNERKRRQAISTDPTEQRENRKAE